MRKKVIKHKYQSQKLGVWLILGVDEGTIRVDVKGTSYLTALEDYKIEVRKAEIESDKNIIFEAQNIIEINADEWRCFLTLYH